MDVFLILEKFVHAPHEVCPVFRIRFEKFVCVQGVQHINQDTVIAKLNE